MKMPLAFSQMFNLLCGRADNVHGGRLPHHVRMLWDEAAKHDLWWELAGSGKITAHLLDIDDTAQEWMDRMLPQMTETDRATKELKAHDQLVWVGLVNNCGAKAEEIILDELIYS